jgi:6-phosphogluconolactonase
VLAANYGGGSVVVLPVRDDGSLDPPSAFVQHQGSSVHPRQQGPHAHSVTVDPADRFVMSADLGLDQVLIYRYDIRRGTLTPHELMAAAKVTPGAGPRHFTFHPGSRFAYVINELNSTVTAFRFDADRGTLEAIQEISTLPDNFHGENTTAEVAVSPDGRFLYGSNRGHDSLVVYAIDTPSGRLSHVSHHASGGEIPRNFAIDPTGTFLLAANQRTGNVVVFRIDPATGQLIDTGFSVDVPQAVCVTFVNDTP